MNPVNRSDWDNFLELFPNHHILQTTQWADLKQQAGWRAVRVVNQSSEITIGAQILLRKIVPGINIAYLPKGPVFNTTIQSYPPKWSSFWQQVDKVCKHNYAFFLKVEPDIWISSENLDQNQIPLENEPGFSPVITKAADTPQGFIPSSHSIQPNRTLILDIRGNEDMILSRMKPKTRYNIKLALKRGVIVHPTENIENFSKMMEITGNRDGFGIHGKDYYQSVFQLFHTRNECRLFSAEYQHEILASIMVFSKGNRAWYLYGASSNEKRELMPTYILQWEAIRWAKSRGCVEYDLWGVPDANLSELEANFTQRNDNLWGVYRFKRGFGGNLLRSAGPWDRVYNPLFYRLYRTVVK